MEIVLIVSPISAKVEYLSVDLVYVPTHLLYHGRVEIWSSPRNEDTIDT